MKTPSFTALALAVACSAASAEHFIQYDSPLIPLGLRPGDSFHLVFPTSGTTNRNSGDGEDNFPISHWNTFVTNQAAASTVTALQPHLAAIEWKALVSTTLVHARDNAPVSAPVYRLDGQLVATGFDDLWNGSVMIPVEITQNLTVVPSNQANLVYTGSTSAGFADSRYPLGNGSQSAKTGRAAQIGAGWISGSDAERRNPTNSLRMYAMSELITIAIPPDTDGDGLPDWWEELHFGGPTAANPHDDPDGDGLTNIQEFELDSRLSPVDFDTDNDGLLDGHSITLTSDDPRYAIWTAAGISHFDTEDGRTFRGELTMGTDPLNPDTDGDGLLDGVESNTGIWVGPHDTGTDPLNPDTDGDGLLDGVETNTGVFVGPHNTGTNPLLPDTDGDGAGDWYEVYASFTDPTDPNDAPNVPYPLPRPDGSPGATDKPVKVYIIMGQSNATGIGFVNGFRPGSLETIVQREGKFPNLVDESNNWLPRNDVLYRRVSNSSTAAGPLAPGQGASSSQLGPELGFGQIMGFHHDEPVLILKASQGNRSLGGDFLPPGSPRRDVNGITYAGYGDSPRSWPTGTTPVPDNFVAGEQYDISFSTHPNNILATLANFDALYPQWADQGYEIGGFVWWQGHWDQLTSAPYADFYQENLVNFINAVRAEVNAPNAPFVVATIGFGGEPLSTKSERFQKVFNAQMAVQDLPEFVGNVKSVDILKYWREVAESPGNEGHHYNNNAETYMLVGDAAGRAMIEMLDDVTPPSPISFRIPPAPKNPGSIGMVATTANDISGPVEYWFEIIGGANSGWTTSTSWEFTGLTDGQSYDFRFMARDAVGNESDWSATASATASAAGDTTPPSPDPMSFVGLLNVLGENSIAMTATPASDINGVEYEFVCTAGDGPSSGWQASNQFTATGLEPGTTYTYIVRARDGVGNTTADSELATATTTAPDTTPPSPATMSFATPPTALGIDAIIMTATTATDPSGVEYYFEETSGNPGGSDSGWQDSPTYVNNDLQPGTTYTYRVRARDKSPAQNTTNWSAEASATTEVPDTTPPAVISFDPPNGATGVSIGTPLEIIFDEEIVTATGVITLKNLTAGTESTISISDGSQVSVEDSILTINPAGNLARGATYAIRIGSTTIEDLAGNAFPGINDDTTWSFTTSDASVFVVQTTGWSDGNVGGVPTTDSAVVPFDIVNTNSILVATVYIDSSNINVSNIRFGDGTGIGNGDVAPSLSFENSRLRSYVFINPSTASGLAFRLDSATNSGLGVILYEVFGADTNPGSITTVLGGTSITTTTPDELIVSFAGRNATTAPTVNSNSIFTTEDESYNVMRGGGSIASASATAPAVGSNNITWNSAQDGRIAYAFKASSDPVGPNAYDAWAAQIPDQNLRGRADDADGDGFTNLQEFLFGTSPIEPDGSLTTTEKSGSDLIIRWNERTEGAVYTLLESGTLDNDWIPSGVVPVNDGSAAGGYQPRMATVPIGSGTLFLRVRGVEN